MPLVPLALDGDINLLEIFHGPSYSFKDCALQFLGNLFEYLLAQKNVGKEGKDRYHLTVVGATSGDTGSAAIYGLRGKKDVSVTILHPKGRVSAIQEAQMTTCTEQNVHNLAITGTFDDCQDIVKKLFGDDATNKEVKLGAVYVILVLVNPDRANNRKGTPSIGPEFWLRLFSTSGLTSRSQDNPILSLLASLSAPSPLPATLETFCLLTSPQRWDFPWRSLLVCLFLTVYLCISLT